MSKRRKLRRSERLGDAFVKPKFASDTAISGILQSVRESIGAILEGKNRSLSRIFEKTTSPGHKKKTRNGKLRRFLHRDVMWRCINAANATIDTVGTATIGLVDVVNQTQGAVHDAIYEVATGKESRTSRGFITPLLTATFGDVLLKRVCKEAVWNGLGKNKVGDHNFDISSGRNYGATLPPAPPRKKRKGRSSGSKKKRS